MNPRTGLKTFTSSLIVASGIVSLCTGLFIVNATNTWSKNTDSSGYHYKTGNFAWNLNQTVRTKSVTFEKKNIEVTANSIAVQRKLNPIRARVIAKVVRKAKPVTMKAKVVADRIAVTAAAPAKVEVTEFEIMQSIYQSLGKRFDIAVNSAGQKKQPTVIVQEIQPVIKPVVVIRKSVAKAKKPVEAAKKAVSIQKPVLVAKAKVAEKITKQLVEDEYSVPKPVQISPINKVAPETDPNKIVPKIKHYDKTDKIIIRQAAPEVVKAEPPKATKPVELALPAQPKIETPQKVIENEYSFEKLATMFDRLDRSAEPKVVEAVKPVKMSTQENEYPNVEVTTQFAGPYAPGASKSPIIISFAAPTANPAPVAVPKEEQKIAPTISAAALRFEEPKPEPTVPPAVEKKPDPQAKAIARFVEAFDVTAEVHSVRQAALSSGWKQVEATNHWKTLYWDPTETAAGVALLSNNDAYFLQPLTNTKIQNQAGIVIGRVNCGWNVKLSNRADAPQLFAPDAEGREKVPTDSSVNCSGTRTFVFQNVEPGANLLYVQRVSTQGERTEGALGIPVLSGTSTFINLLDAKFITVSGHVFDASQEKLKGFKRTQVSVVGHPQVVFANQKGEFKLNSVLQVQDHPILMESEATNGFTHRYSISPSQAQAVELYYSPAAMIEEWETQLEGGVSPKSGIVFAAIPDVISRHEPASLFPYTETLFAKDTLAAETYTLSPQGRLMIHRALEANSVRFLSLQVPEGLAIAGAVNKEGRKVWGELIFVSPSVINVVGPY